MSVGKQYLLDRPVTSSYAHEFTVAMVTGTRLSQDQANQNPTMDGVGLTKSHPYILGDVGTWGLLEEWQYVCFGVTNAPVDGLTPIRIQVAINGPVSMMQGAVYENKKNMLHTCMKLSKAKVKSNLEISKD